MTPAHAAQMQALAREAAGTRSSNAGSNATASHQQASAKLPDRAGTQPFGPPHSGQASAAARLALRGYGRIAARDGAAVHFVGMPLRWYSAHRPWHSRLSGLDAAAAALFGAALPRCCFSLW